MKKKKMAPLSGPWFTNSEDMPELLAENLEAASLGYPVNSVLGKNGWDGRTVAAVGLELSPDNRQVRRGQLIMRGPLSAEPAVIQASKLWEKGDKDVTVNLFFPQAAEFDFVAGTLASEYLTSDGIKMVCAKNGQPMLPTDWARHGIGNFCLRLIAYVVKGPTASHRPSIKFAILFFPLKHDEMAPMSNLTRGAGWPGIKILEGDAQLFPPAPTDGWGCPIYPILCPGRSFAQVPNLPSGVELRFVISKIMQTARQPTSCASNATLRKKWDRMLADPEEYSERMSPGVWPDMPSPPVIAGE